MLIPFCSNTRGSGAGLAQGFGEKYYPQGWRFFRQTEGTDLGKAASPVLPLRIKREQPVLRHRILWSRGREAKVQRLKWKTKKVAIRKMRDNHLMKYK